MTLQQIEYIVALDQHRSFLKAAAVCHVSQPSLSAAIAKLEDELGVKIFDRSRQPVIPTDIGQDVILQGRRMLSEAANLLQVVSEHQKKVQGAIRIGVIPTLAPYLLPLFLKDFAEKYPDVSLSIRENTTEQLLDQLHRNEIDAAILATPLNDPGLKEELLFYEDFAVYAPHEPQILNKQYLLSEEIEPDKLLLLEEGHCMRTQIENLCALQRAASHSLQNITYEVGSLETLKRLVENHVGITILPQLALLDLNEEQMQYVRFFQDPAPVREISLVFRQVQAKYRLLTAFKNSILDNLPSFLTRDREKRVLGIR
jgi:LysR family hydrogen peroxide-inducible transcriptional activator